MFEVILHNGDRAEADSEAGILLAARWLIRDASRMAGAQRMFRRDVIVTCDGIYNGRLTKLAQEGR
jgi:hypothetical protein